MPLPSFAITGNMKDVLGNIGASVLDEEAISRAILEFASNVPRDIFVTYGATMKKIDIVYGAIDDNGNIVTPNGDTVLLLANDDGLSFKNVKWRVTITIPPNIIPPLPRQVMRSWEITAGLNGTSINLASYVPSTIPTHDQVAWLAVDNGDGTITFQFGTDNGDGTITFEEQGP